MPTSAEIPLDALPAFGQEISRGVIQGDYKPAIEQVILAAKSDFKERFNTCTSPDGQAWPPIRGFRVRGPRLRSGGEAKALRDTGILYASATAQGKGHIETISQYSMELGTNLEYAWVHQHGATVRPVSGKALAIPLTIEAKRHGGPMRPNGPFPIKLTLVWPKGKPFGFLVEFKGGKGKANRKAMSVMHYLLVSKVEIPKREFIGWSPRLLETTDAILQDRMTKLATERLG